LKPASPVLVIPHLGPPVRKVESYPLGDYLYDRSKAADDLKKAHLAWLYYMRAQPIDVQEAVVKIRRLFRNRPDYDYA
jgi:hypothetical protein